MEKISKSVMWFFIVGLVLTAMVAIAIPAMAEWCFVPAVFVGFVAVGIRYFTGATDKFEWLHLVAAIVGAMVIQVFCWIG